MIRIAHFADVHLDRPFVGMSLDDARGRRRGLREAFDRCLHEAVARGAHVVTIGGDLWEDEHVTPDTLRWVADRLKNLGLPVVIGAGNHDPLSPGGPYDRAAFSPNVTVLPAGETLSDFAFEHVTLWGVSWRRGLELTAAPLHAFRAPRDNQRHLLLLHGTCGLQIDDEGPKHCAFSGDDVQSAGLELCLAGHLHGAGTRQEHVAYPGSPEPLTWSEDGRHTMCLIDVPVDGAINVEYLDINQQRYLTRNVDVTGAESHADVERAVLAELDTIDPAGLSVRVQLTGRIERGCEPDVAALRSLARPRGLVTLLVRDKTAVAFDVDDLAAGAGVTGIFVTRMRDRIDAAEPHADLALELGLRALAGETLS